MKDFHFKFDLEGFNNLFPFFILIDNDLNINKFGNSLLKLIPHLKENQSFSDVFRVKRPEITFPSFNAFLELYSQLVIIETVVGSSIIFRGQFQQYNNSILFVGSPWFVSMDEVIENNLKLNDFAIHDSLIDLLHVLKNQENRES